MSVVDERIHCVKRLEGCILSFFIVLFLRGFVFGLKNKKKTVIVERKFEAKRRRAVFCEPTIKDTTPVTNE